jgi:hypothetical protein
VVNATPRSLYPRLWPGTHFIGGWVDPRARLGGCHIVIYGLSRSIIVFHISHKRQVIKHKICVLIFSTTFFLKHFSFQEELSEIWSKSLVVSMYSTRYSCPILMKLEFSRQFFEKYANIKFLENPSSGSRVAPYGQKIGRTDLLKLIVAFRNFVNAPKNCVLYGCAKKQRLFSCTSSTNCFL